MQIKVLAALGILLSSLPVRASEVPFSFTYQGDVVNEDGESPLLEKVNLTISIYDPSGTCLLYQEQQKDLDLSLTKGSFAVKVGSNYPEALPIKRTDKDQHLPLKKIFANEGQTMLPGSVNCVNGYSPKTYDSRILKAFVVTGDKELPLLPDLEINSVPNSLVAESIQGVMLNSIVQTNGSAKSKLIFSANVDRKCQPMDEEDKSWISQGKIQGNQCLITLRSKVFTSKPKCSLTMWQGQNKNGAKLIAVNIDSIKFTYDHQPKTKGPVTTLFCMGSKD